MDAESSPGRSRDLEQRIVSAIRHQQSAELREAVFACTDEAKSKGEPIERVIVALKQFGLGTADARFRYEKLAACAVTWSIDRYYGSDAPERAVTPRDSPKIRPAKTIASALLATAIEAFGTHALAGALQTDAVTLDRINTERLVMTLHQHRALALAVMVLSDDHPQLRGRAQALLGQVEAKDAYERGDTMRHPEPPGQFFKF